MNARHAAALALVGWYFIYPPRPDVLSAPLTQWQRGNTVPFKSQQECDAFRGAAHKINRADPSPEHQAKAEEALRTGICVSSDDPRLKP